MIGIVAVTLVLGGIAGLVSFWAGSSFTYWIKLELGLLWHLGCIAVGVGLWFRREWARIGGLGIFLAGALMLPVAIVWLIFNRHELGNAFGLLVYITLMYSAKVQSATPLQILYASVATLGVLFLAGSLFSWWLYRYFQRPHIAEQFSDNEPAATPRLAIWAIALAGIGAAMLYSHGLEISQAQLPSFLQSRVYKENVKARAKANDQQRLEQLANLAGEIQFASDGSTAVVATRRGDAHLFAIDLARAAATLKDAKLYGFSNATNEPDRLAAFLSPDNRWFFAGGRLIDLRTDQARALASAGTAWIVPLGFSLDSAMLLWHSPQSGKLEGVDLAADRVVFSIDATRPEWAASDHQKSQLRRALREGAFSPSRERFAYVFENRLHLLSLPQGALEIDERPLTQWGGGVPAFSKEGDALLLTINGAIGQPPLPGVLYVLSDKGLHAHQLRPPVLYFSSDERRVLSYGVDHIAEHGLDDLVNARRKIPLPQNAAYTVIDGRLLAMKTHGRPTVEIADLTAVPTSEGPTFQPVPLKMPISAQSYVRFVAAGGRLAVISGPSVEIIEPAAPTSGSQLHRLAMLLPKPQAK